MLAFVAEGGNHQVGGAVHHFRSFEEIRRRIHEAAEPHHAHDFIEIAERGFDLCQHVDRTRARRLLALLERYAGTEFAGGDEFAAWPETVRRLPVRTNGT